MRLKELREERKLTQKEISLALKTSQANISRWEKEEMDPASSFVIKLADFFEVSADYLLGRSDELGAVTVQSSAPPLSAEENALLATFRKMTSAQKARFLAYGDGLIGAELPAGAKKA